jgi:uncharacterized protein involved in exopolysaccharide biosynthesis
LDVNFDPRTSVVEVRCTAKDQQLAVVIARRLLAALNEFNISTLQTSAGARRRFLEGRVRDARGELAVAEDSLRRFYISNRQYQQSPELVLREASLRQTYTLKQQNLVSLITNLEQARIDQVRDTPVLTVLEEPLVPAKPSGPKRLLLAFGVATFWLGIRVVLIALGSSISRLSVERPTEIAVIKGSWGTLRDGLRRRR